MKRNESLRFQKGDILAVAAVILLAVFTALCFLPGGSEDALCAEIYLNSEKIRTVSLEEAQTFTVTGRYTNQITVSEGKIAITHSDCPGNDCVHMGYVGSGGHSIVCLPNGLEIRIVGDEDVDFVVG